MKTPLQQLIQTFKTYANTDLDNQEMWMLAVEDAERLLEKEEELIKEVYWEGGQEVPAHETSVDNWYNKTFNNEER